MQNSEDRFASLLAILRERWARGENPDTAEIRSIAGDDYEELLGALPEAPVRESTIADAESGAEWKLPHSFGGYTLVEFLGKGNFGVVYKAMQKTLRRTVAVKILRGDWIGEPSIAERFERGASAAAQIEHDHVVRIHDAGVHEQRPYLVMGLLEGPSLAEVYGRLKAVGPPPFTEKHHQVLDELGVPGARRDTAGFARRLSGLLAGPSDALAAYHAIGILHRDVKPGNLLFDAQGRLVLSDFDLARVRGTSLRILTSAAVGTPFYMSPEQWEPGNEQIDGRADLYSLAVVLYEGLTQRCPFRGETVGELWQSIMTKPAKDPATIVPDVPSEVRRVLLKALEKRPDDRYDSAAALARDLRAVSRGEEVDAQVPSAMTRFLRRAWRRRRLVPIAGVLILAWLAWLWSMHPGPAQAITVASTDASQLVVSYSGGSTPTRLQFEGDIGSQLLLAEADGSHEGILVGLCGEGRDYGTVVKLERDFRGRWREAWRAPPPSGLRHAGKELRYHVRALLCGDFLQQEPGLEIVCVRYCDYYPTLLSLYTAQGQHVGSLTHRGVVNEGCLVLPRSQGLVFTGCSNRTRAGEGSFRPSGAGQYEQVIFCIRAEDIDGLLDEAGFPPWVIERAEWYRWIAPKGQVIRDLTTAYDAHPDSVACLRLEGWRISIDAGGNSIATTSVDAVQIPGTNEAIPKPSLIPMEQSGLVCFVGSPGIAPEVQLGGVDFRWSVVVAEDEDPPDTFRLRLEPGSHAMTIAYQGHEWTEAVVVRAGETTELQLR